MSNVLPFTIKAGALPPNAKYTPQEFLEALADAIQIESQQQFAVFEKGAIDPVSNRGPFLKNEEIWRVWKSATGAYGPLVVEQESLRYIVSSSIPDSTTYDLWVKLNVSGKAEGLYKYYSGAWVDAYDGVFYSKAEVDAKDTVISGTVTTLTGRVTTVEGKVAVLEPKVADLEAAAAAAYTAVQQGGGIGQGTDKLYLGWTAGSRLGLTVGAVDRSPIVTDNDFTAKLNDSAILESLYQKLMAYQYPVGEIYVTLRTGSPGGWIPGTTWARFGEGRVMVGFQTGVYTPAESTGGSATVTLAMGNIPEHSHTVGALSGTTNSVADHAHSVGPISSTTGDAGSHSHTYSQDNRIYGSATGVNTTIASPAYGSGTVTNIATSTQPNHNHTISIGAFNSGNSGGHGHTVSIAGFSTNNAGSATPTAISVVQPYVVVYMWKRVS
jgi:hypothetical protein